MDDKGEHQRIAALQGYGVLDTPNEAEFDAIVREAAALMRTPMALISLVDENRQWFKAKIGITAAETPRSISFCTHAIRGDEMMVVRDAQKDSRFAHNPFVSGDPGIRFYAGMPLKTPEGARIGTLCVVDSKPHRTPTSEETVKLAELAQRTITAMEKRKQRNARLAGRA